MIIIDKLSETTYIATYHKSVDEEMTYLFSLNIVNIIRLYEFIEMVKVTFNLKHIKLIIRNDTNCFNQELRLKF